MATSLPDLASVLASREPSHPLAVRACRELATRLPFASRMLANQDRLEGFWDDAEERVREVQALFGGAAHGLEGAVGAWIEFSLEYLKRQSRFLRSGHYQATDFHALRQTLYDDPGRMRGFYLPALLLSFVFSSNYIGYLRFFRRELLPVLGPASRVADIGCGHGLYLAEMMQAGAARGMGIDISESSLAVTRALLHHRGIAAGRVELRLGDLHSRLPLEPGSLDAAAFFEVIEHLAAPAAALAELQRVLAPGGVLCMSAAIRMESVDHLHLFRSPEEVLGLVEAAGFRVRREELWPLSGEDLTDPAVRGRLVADPETALGLVLLAERRP